MTKSTTFNPCLTMTECEDFYYVKLIPCTEDEEEVECLSSQFSAMSSGSAPSLPPSQSQISCFEERNIHSICPEDEPHVDGGDNEGTHVVIQDERGDDLGLRDEWEGEHAEQVRDREELIGVAA